jgi:hypothetical protein
MSNYQQYPPPSSPPAGQTSTLALVSVISGVLGWSLLPTIGAIVAVITGHMAKGEIRRSGGFLTGDGLATAGLILGYLHLVLVVVAVCLLIVLPLLGLGGLGLCLPFFNEFNINP